MARPLGRRTGARDLAADHGCHGPRWIRWTSTPTSKICWGSSFTLTCASAGSAANAVGHHAKPRATKDLDLLISDASNNLARAANALAQFGVPRPVVDAVRVLQPHEIAYLGVPPLHVDIMCRADGIDTEEIIQRAVFVHIEGLVVPFIGLSDLIVNKRASGRPQDVADVALLEKVKERT